MKDEDKIKDTTASKEVKIEDTTTSREIKPERMDSIVIGAEIGKPKEAKSTTEKIVEKVKKVEAKKKKVTVPKRDVPCILKFKKKTAKQAANIALLFKKLNYKNYRIDHSRGHGKWDITVWFKSEGERDKFEERINKLL